MNAFFFTYSPPIQYLLIKFIYCTLSLLKLIWSNTKYKIKILKTDGELIDWNNYWPCVSDHLSYCFLIFSFISLYDSWKKLYKGDCCRSSCEQFLKLISNVLWTNTSYLSNIVLATIEFPLSMIFIQLVCSVFNIFILPLLPLLQ